MTNIFDFVRGKSVVSQNKGEAKAGFTLELTKIETPRNDTECVELRCFGPQSADLLSESVDCGQKQRKSTHCVVSWRFTLCKFQCEPGLGNTVSFLYRNPT